VLHYRQEKVEVEMKNLMLKRIVYAAVIVAMCITALPTSFGYAAGSIYRVKPTGADSGTCGDAWDNACSLPYALNLATTGDQLWVAKGFYKPTTGTDRTISFNLKDGVAVYGGFLGNESELTQRDPAANVSVLSGDIGVTGNKSDNSYHVVNGFEVNNIVLDGFTINGGNADDTSVRAHSIGAGMNLYKTEGILNQLIFTNNYAAQLGAGAAINRCDPTITNVTFQNNRSGNTGGGLALYLSEPTISNTLFENNTADVNGGGMYNEESTPTMNQVTFTGNTSQDYGGGMFNYLSGPLVTDATFTGNSSGHIGGAVANSGREPVYTNVVFSNNSSVEGGAASNYMGTITYKNVTFTGNSSTNNGGAMFNEVTTVIVTDAEFSGNSTAEKGGAIHNYATTATYTRVNFKENHAGYSGAGMFSYEGNLYVTDATFVDNTADLLGGALANYLLTETTFTNVIIENNTAPWLGGGMYNDTVSPVITDVTFSNNSASKGGAMYNELSKPVLKNVTFAGNSAQFSGAGIYGYSSKINLVNVTMTDNASGSDGAAVYLGSGSITMTNTTLVNNNTEGPGGVLGMEYANAVIRNSILWGNTSGWGEPEVYLGTDAKLDFSNSVSEYGCPAKATCSNLIMANPKLGSLSDNGGFTLTYPLLKGSSAINKANNTICPSKDQRGVLAPQGYKCDIGAYEALVPGVFSKRYPGRDAVDRPANLKLKWNASSNAAKYVYCIDQSADKKCDTGWKAVGTATSVSLSGLEAGTYYWQVRAKNALGFTTSNNGKWWSFTVAP
jgi:predicted outer membrane repeat protein